MNQDRGAGCPFHNTVASRVIGVPMCINYELDAQTKLSEEPKDLPGFLISVKRGINDCGLLRFVATHNVTVREVHAKGEHFCDHHMSLFLGQEW